MICVIAQCLGVDFCLLILFLFFYCGAMSFLCLLNALYWSLFFILYSEFNVLF